MRLFLVVIKGYSVFVALWFLSYLFFQDSYWILVGLDKFAEYFLVLSIPFLLVAFLVALVSKQLKPIVYAIIPVAVSGYFYLPLFLPFGVNPNSNTNTAAGDQTVVRVMTFNIWNHNKDFDAVVSAVTESEPTIVAMQEITEEQKPEIVKRMTLHYPYYHISRAVYGGTTALFSKIPLQNVVELEFNIDRPAILADVNIDDKTVTVISAHLNPSFWAYYQKQWHEIPALYHQYIKDQNTQARMIIDSAKSRKDSSATFLACDCNSQETASTNRLLRSYFEDTFDALGWQRGEPGSEKFKFERDLSHIDYVWFHGNANPLVIYRVKHSAGSDHNPIVADFVL